MKLDQLKAFYVVARTGSFTKAAEEMNVDQSSVSRKIINLESRTRVRLFLRLSRGLILTREGEELLKKTRHILNEIEDLKNLSASDSFPSGVLKVSTSHSLASMMLLDYIPGFLQEHPGMEVVLMDHNQELDLIAREADVAFRPYQTNASDLCQKYLMTFKFYLYAGPEYLEQFGMPQKPEDLTNHRLICYKDWTEKPYADFNWILRVGIPIGKEHKAFFQVNTMHGLLKAAQLNMGIATFCEELPHFEKTGLTKVLPDIKGPEIDIFYTYPKELEHSKFITCFGEYMEKSISSEYKIKSVSN